MAGDGATLIKAALARSLTIGVDNKARGQSLDGCESERTRCSEFSSRTNFQAGRDVVVP
jgi:hypothetical protein